MGGGEPNGGRSRSLHGSLAGRLEALQQLCVHPSPSVQETKALFLEAQALWGLGQTEAAAVLCGKVLRRDPSHAMAADLAAELRAQGQPLE